MHPCLFSSFFSFFSKIRKERRIRVQRFSSYVIPLIHLFLLPITQLPQQQQACMTFSDVIFGTAVTSMNRFFQKHCGSYFITFKDIFLCFHLLFYFLYLIYILYFKLFLCFTFIRMFTSITLALISSNFCFVFHIFVYKYCSNPYSCSFLSIVLNVLFISYLVIYILTVYTQLFLFLIYNLLISHLCSQFSM